MLVVISLILFGAFLRWWMIVLGAFAGIAFIWAVVRIFTGVECVEGKSAIPRAWTYLTKGMSWAFRILLIFVLSAAWLSFTRAWYPPIVEGVVSLTWPAAEGRLLSAAVMEQYGGGRGARAGPRMSLSYYYEAQDVSGQVKAWRGGRYNTFHAAATGLPFFQRGMTLEAIRRADNLRVYYEPANPNVSVLNPGIPVESFFLALFWVPLSLLLIHAWRYALAGDFWRRMAEPFTGVWPSRIRVAAVIAFFGCFFYLMLFALSWGSGIEIPAWAVGAIFVGSLAILAFPKVVHAAFQSQRVQLAGALLFGAFCLVTFVLWVSWGYREHQGADANRDRSIPEAYIAPLEKLNWAMNSPHLTLRYWALDHLRLYPRGEAAVPLLRQGLADANPPVRSQAIWTISNLPPPTEEFDEDIMALLDDPDAKVRHYAVRSARGWVEERLVYDKSSKTRRQVRLPAPILSWQPDKVERLATIMRRLVHASGPKEGYDEKYVLAGVEAAQRKAQKPAPRGSR